MEHQDCWETGSGDTQIPLKAICDKVVWAIEKLYRCDHELLDRNVNERSITHKLAEYLQHQFPKWNVDCEYNRLFEDTKTMVFQKLSKSMLAKKSIDEESVIDTEIDTEARTVYPDIIVHKRGQRKNLVVIEAKKRSSASNSGEDTIKLREFTKIGGGFEYRVGFLLFVGEHATDFELYVYFNGEQNELLTKKWSKRLRNKLQEARD